LYTILWIELFAMNVKNKTLRLVLGDQLNLDHSWLKSIRHDVIYVIMEVRQETDYVMHHIQKVLAFFAAMRDFARQLREKGHQVHYIKLDDPENTQSIPGNLTKLIQEKNITQFEHQQTDEYRLDRQMRQFCESLSIPTTVTDSEHFLTSRSDVADFFKGKKQYILESFYRMMRKRLDILLENGQPIGGTWNYDQENRQPYDGKVPVPKPILFENNIGDLKQLLIKEGVKTFGLIDAEGLIWPINRQQALEVLRFFIEQCLPYFGRYEDAMTRQHWAMFHSRLSFALNTKMLHPMETVEAALQAWEQNKTRITLPQIEGFVRQIIGWREFMRGVYWAQMPDYEKLNFFEHTHKLPHYYWDGKTNMQCLRFCFDQSLKYAFAHHIQRLMITGNFALLAGIHPDDVDTWYMGIYIDAIQWVEITNTRGMSQFADGGIIATKPYISSARYIQKMSDYCIGCHYDPNKKYGDRACPFNSLYWAFYHRHRDKLSKNPRIGMMYRLLDRFSDEERLNILKQAKWYLKHIEDL
jgi:deoxyribodipyrimidine photolyase-related protein